MPRTRGGDRSKRSNYCVSCKSQIAPRAHAQMLRFTYLCQDCHGQGLRLVLVDTALTGGKTVRLVQSATTGEPTMADKKDTEPQAPLPTGSNCAHIGCH